MPEVADWRDPSNYEPDDALDWPSIAMGYLARNEAYRADHADALQQVNAGAARAPLIESMIRRWGITFPLDAIRRRDLRDVIVTPDRCPGALVMIPAPDTSGSSISLMAGRMLEPGTQQSSNGDGYVILRAPDGDHRLWLNTDIADPQALLLPFDEHLNIRIAAAHRLYRHLRGIPAPPSPLRPTPLQRDRHLCLFRLLDGRAVGARARMLASVLIDHAVAQYAAAEWADSRERKKIGRWTVEAERLRDGGYTELITGR